MFYISLITKPQVEKIQSIPLQFSVTKLSNLQRKAARDEKTIYTKANYKMANYINGNRSWLTTI
jgi:hypothetical protein